MTKKIFAMFLAVLMVVSMLPTSVFAAKECPGAGNHTKDNCDCTVIEVTAPTCGEARLVSPLTCVTTVTKSSLTT